MLRKEKGEIMKKMSLKMSLMFVITILLVGNLFAADSIAKTLQKKGTIYLTHDLKISKLKNSEDLFINDELETAESSFAAVRFNDDNSLVKLFPHSILKLNIEIIDNKIAKKNTVTSGKFWAKVTKNKAGFEVATPSTVCSVKGTEFLVSVADDGTTDCYTFEGEVQMTNKSSGAVISVPAGKKGQSTSAGLLNINDFDPADIDADVLGFIQETIPEKPKFQKPKSPVKPPSVKPRPKPVAPDGQEPTSDPVIPGVQDVPEVPEASDEPQKKDKNWNMGGGVGTINIGENIYTRFSLMPEITFGKFGIGLNIELLIDGNGDVREEDWDEWQDYINKILYIRYAKRGDPFFARIGSFPSYTLGHGLVMKNYSNMLRFPAERQIGLQLGGKLPIKELELEVFTSNVTKNEILAFRPTIKPLFGTNIPILKNLKLGGTLAHDKNQYLGLTEEAIALVRFDTDGDGFFDEDDSDPDGDNLIDPNSLDGLSDDVIQEMINAGLIDDFEDLDEFELGTDDVTVASVDYTLPLIETKFFTLGHYAEAAKILEHNMGFIFPGFYSKFLIFDMALEYRMFEDDFAPAFFDELYDEQRAYIVYETNDVVSKEDLLWIREKSQGWYGSVTANLFKILYITVAYEDMYTENSGNYRGLWGKAALKQNLVPKISRAEITYSQTGFDKLEYFKTTNALLTGTLAYSLGGSTQLVMTYQERYVDIMEPFGEIKGTDETVTTMNFGVEFKF